MGYTITFEDGSTEKFASGRRLVQRVAALALTGCTPWPRIEGFDGDDHLHGMLYKATLRNVHRGVSDAEVEVVGVPSAIDIIARDTVTGALVHGSLSELTDRGYYLYGVGPESGYPQDGVLTSPDLPLHGWVLKGVLKNKYGVFVLSPDGSHVRFTTLSDVDRYRVVDPRNRYRGASVVSPQGRTFKVIEPKKSDRQGTLRLSPSSLWRFSLSASPADDQIVETPMELARAGWRFEGDFRWGKTDGVELGVELGVRYHHKDEPTEDWYTADAVLHNGAVVLTREGKKTRFTTVEGLASNWVRTKPNKNAVYEGLSFTNKYGDLWTCTRVDYDGRVYLDGASRIDGTPAGLPYDHGVYPKVTPGDGIASPNVGLFFHTEGEVIQVVSTLPAYNLDVVRRFGEPREGEEEYYLEAIDWEGFRKGPMDDLGAYEYLGKYFRDSDDCDRYVVTNVDEQGALVLTHPLYGRSGDLSRLLSNGFYPEGDLTEGKGGASPYYRKCLYPRDEVLRSVLHPYDFQVLGVLLDGRAVIRSENDADPTCYALTVEDIEGMWEVRGHTIDPMPWEETEDE